jgi:DNA-binding NarL/FixJ family response regulator
VRLVIADDSVIVREGVTRLLTREGHEVLESVADPDRLLAATATGHPDAVLVDIKMPPTFTDEGLRAADTIRARFPGVGVLVLSQYVVAEYAMALLAGGEAGVGYLLKDRVMDPSQLSAALARVCAGGTVIDPELVADLLRTSRTGGPTSALTDRESDVLALMAEGLSDKGIAERLFVSLNTVGTHVQRIFRKLDLPDGAADNRRVHAVLLHLRTSS